MLDLDDINAKREDIERRIEEMLNWFQDTGVGIDCVSLRKADERTMAFPQQPPPIRGVILKTTLGPWEQRKEEGC